MLLALTYLGGDAAQIDLGLPNAVTGIFQGILLFYLLGCDFLLLNRVPGVGRPPRGRTAMTALLIAFSGQQHCRRDAAAAGRHRRTGGRGVGVLNLGVEGMMLAGAIAAFAATHVTGMTTLGMLAAIWPARCCR